ncbi:blue copper protein-like [Prosopis cineraria]|uniref:blue copper protein-like n=1 Tax=Prosopis cineraria TaxID=364024 RepID=UPI00240EECBE|nr:blue copper protein-like [Prosopis cineraria]
MEPRTGSSSSAFLFTNLCSLLLLLVLVLSFSGSARAYKNYTVGDSLGWFDNLEKPDVDYQNWASDKHFFLGDFLIFNTDTNHSVIQTYNHTTYKQCDYDDAQDKDTTEWSASDPSNTEVRPVTVAVPLVKEGMTYFFSSDYDGEQCQNGQRFQINVTYGQGLPKSLRDNPSYVDSSPSPASSPVSGSDDVAPDTIVNGNFTNPKGSATSDKDDDDDDDDVKANSGSVSVLILQNFMTSCVGLLFCLALLSWF